MDAHLFRPNQMSYFNHQQQPKHSLSNQRPNKSHYSNRQQHNQLQQQQQLAAGNLRQAQAQNLNGNQNNLLSSAGSSGSSGDDDNIHLSSISTSTNKTNSSHKAMLSNHHNSKQQQQQHHMMQQQHQQKHRQAAAAVAAAHHSNRQAALQAHTLTAPTGGVKSSSGNHNHNNTTGNFTKPISSSNNHNHNVADNMTTSSSDHTIDDLHHLAHGYGGHHRLTGSRFSGEGSAASASSSQSGSRFLLGVLFTLAELLLFATVFLWLYWVYQHDDGLAWQNDRKQQFNTHAALMLLGFIFLSGQAMLIYRSFQCCSKIYTKILHTILFVLATSAISLGLILGYTAQENVGPNSKPIMHFYSLHAWIGLTTVGLFVLQFVFGFISFLILLCCDSATSKFRAALLPIHKTFGLIIFSLAVTTCLTGLLQTARSRLSSKLNKVDYHELAEPGIVLNLIGVCLICLAILMPYIIRNLDIKRPVRSELDRHLRLSQLDMRI